MESSQFLLVQPWCRVGGALVDLCHSKAAIPLQPQPLQTCRSWQLSRCPVCHCPCSKLSAPVSCHCQLSKSRVCGRGDVPRRQHKAEEHRGHCAIQLSPLTLSFSFYFDQTLLASPWLIPKCCPGACPLQHFFYFSALTGLRMENHLIYHLTRG